MKPHCFLILTAFSLLTFSFIESNESNKTTPIYHNSAKEVVDIVDDANKNKISEPLLDTTKIKKIPIKTKIKKIPIKNSYNDPAGNLVWELSNGAKVVVKKTNPKNNQIIVRSLKSGGRSILSAEEDYIASLLVLTNVPSICKLSNIDLREFMKNKKCNLSISISEYDSWIDGYSSTENLETLMQIINLKHTDPFFSEANYKEFIAATKINIQRMTDNPSSDKFDTLDLYGRKRIKERTCLTNQMEDKLNTASLNKIKTIYHKIFDGVNGTTFFFVGDININKLKDYTEKYIATLPAGNHIKGYGNIKLEPIKGKTYKTFKTKEDGFTTHVIHSGNNIHHNFENALGLDILNKFLVEKFYDIYKAEGIQSNIYSQSRITKIPNEYYKLSFNFSTNSENKNKMISYISNAIENIAKGVTKLDDANIETIKKELINKHNSDIKDNNN